MMRSGVARIMGRAALFVVLLASRQAVADYPIMSHRYLADPGSLVYNGEVYLYMSNDDDNAVAGGYAMHSIVCASTTDMKNWTDHGIVFQVPADASWAQYSWAPQPIERNGTIYLYFGNNANGVGVATSTDPVGVFKDGKGSVLVDASTPGASGTSSWLFDPGALIDDDGQAYLSFGGNGMTNARIIKLGTNLTSVSGSAAALSPTGFFEASFLFKRNGIYCFAYSSDSNNGLRIDYLTSTSPMSGYTYRGTIAGQPPVERQQQSRLGVRVRDRSRRGEPASSVGSEATSRLPVSEPRASAAATRTWRAPATGLPVGGTTTTAWASGRGGGALSATGAPAAGRATSRVLEGEEARCNATHAAATPATAITAAPTANATRPERSRRRLPGKVTRPARRATTARSSLEDKSGTCS